MYQLLEKTNHVTLSGMKSNESASIEIIPKKVTKQMRQICCSFLLKGEMAKAKWARVSLASRTLKDGTNLRTEKLTANIDKDRVFMSRLGITQLDWMCKYLGSERKAKRLVDLEETSQSQIHYKTSYIMEDWGWWADTVLQLYLVWFRTSLIRPTQWSIFLQ